MHVAGLILARGGSKGIPLKNLKPLKGTPLLVWALRSMLSCQGLDSIWVSSDHQGILDVAKQNGAQIHQRSAETSTDRASSLEAIKEFLASHPEVDYIGLVQCTSPFVRTEFLDEAVKKIKDNHFDSVFSVTRSHSLRWAFKTDESNTKHEMVAANFDPSKRPNRQDWEGELVENGAFYFSSVQIIQGGLIQGGRISYVEMSPFWSIDIDTEYDLWLAEQQAVSYGIQPVDVLLGIL